MRITILEMDIDKGTLTLGDEQGKSVKYRRDSVAATAPVTHLKYDPITGWQFMPALLDADTFPEELFVYHPSPGQPPQAPLPVVAFWAGVFRYVLDKG